MFCSFRAHYGSPRGTTHGAFKCMMIKSPEIDTLVYASVIEHDVSLKPSLALSVEYFIVYCGNREKTTVSSPPL